METSGPVQARNGIALLYFFFNKVKFVSVSSSTANSGHPPFHVTTLDAKKKINTSFHLKKKFPRNNGCT